MRALRLLRGTVATAAVWGVAWFIVAAAFTALISAFRPSDLSSLLQAATSIGLWYAITGGWAGGVFALVMAISERRTRFAELTTGRVALLGALGAGSYPLMAWIVSRAAGGSQPTGLGGTLVAFLALGAASAATMLRLAQRDANKPTSALPSGADTRFEAGTQRRASEHVTR